MNAVADKIEPKGDASNESAKPTPSLSIVSSSLENKSERSTSPRPFFTPVKINPKIFTGETNTLADGKSPAGNLDFQNRCKTFSPAVGTVVSLLDSTVVRIVRNKCAKVVPMDEAKEISSLVQRSPEGRKALNESLTRIIARRTNNEEVMDYLVVATALGETTIGLADVLGELRKISDRIDAQQKTEEKLRVN
jgi:hypothetical protein